MIHLLFSWDTMPLLYTGSSEHRKIPKISVCPHFSRLTVGGTTTLGATGVISADTTQENSAGAGGSVLLTTGWIAGSGILRATGGNGINGGGGGGGGRVAIVLTGADAGFATWPGTNSAYGGTGNPAAAGTVYRATDAESPAGGTILVDNRNTATNATFTPLPAFTNSVEDLSGTAWIVRNRGKVAMLTNAVIGSLTLNTNSYLELAGYKLTTKSLTITNLLHLPGTYTAAQLGVLVSDNSGGFGRVVIPNQGTCIRFR